MEYGRIPKDILYGQLALGRRTTGHPRLRYKDVCVRDMKDVDIDTMSWKGLAADRTKWRSALKEHLKTGDEKLMAAPADKRAHRKEGSSSNPQLHIDVMSAIPTLVFLAISDAATTGKKLIKIRKKNIRMYHPWSYLTDGGLYDEQQTIVSTLIFMNSFVQ